MPTDININQLIINEMTPEKYNELWLAGQISETELYLVKDNDTPINSNISKITIPAGRMRGDVNGDGIIDEIDLDIVYRHLLPTNDENYESITDEIDLICADITGNGDIGQSDVTFINKIRLPRTHMGHVGAGVGGDVLGNWTSNPNYETELTQFYTDIEVENITLNTSAIIYINGSYEQDFFRAECINGGIRLYVKLCPITELTAMVHYFNGDGTAVVVCESTDVNNIIGTDIKFDNTDTDLEATNVSDAIKELAIKHTELTGNVVTLPGGATISLSEEFGDAPYVIEISSEGGSSTVVSPSTIKYDNSTSGLTATTMQGAIDELANREDKTVELDTTLEVEGKAADAKSVGDAISNIKPNDIGAAASEHEHSLESLGAQAEITGNENEFVVIGSDGKVMTKSISIPNIVCGTVDLIPGSSMLPDNTIYLYIEEE